MPEPLSEKQLQAAHFRALQNRSFWMTQTYFAGGLAALTVLSLLLPVEKFDKVSPIIFTILGVILREWSSVNGFSFGSSAGSARSNDAMRETLRVNQVEEKKGE